MARLSALTAYAAYLALRQSRDQEAIAAELAQALSRSWNLMDFRALDDSTAIWVPTVLPLIEMAFLQSQRVSAVFTQSVRLAVLPTEPPLNIALPDVQAPKLITPGAFHAIPAGGGPMEVDHFPEKRVITSLISEANIETKKRMPGPEAELMEKAESRSTGAAVRHAMDGSRGVTDRVMRDRRVLGYARVTDSDPCAFCALLASRGAVFKKDSFQGSDAQFAPHPEASTSLPEKFSDVAKVHDHCCCSLRPVYTRTGSFDAAAKYWRNGWDAIYARNPYDSNSNHIKQFREWHQANPFPGVQFDLHSLKQDLANRREALLDAGFAEDSPQVQWAEGSRNNLAA